MSRALGAPQGSGDTAERLGVWLAVGAYGLWGLVPLFWPLARPAGALEILADRIVWSLVCCVVLLVVARRLGLIAPEALAVLRHRRTVGVLALAAVCVSLNWGLYIWSVISGHVVEAALGYYINPVLSILLGVLVLRERLRRAQWIAVALASVAVVVLTVGYGRLPWVGLGLAVSFAAYALIKSRVRVHAVVSLSVESAVITPFALAYLVASGCSAASSSVARPAPRGPWSPRAR